MVLYSIYYIQTQWHILDVYSRGFPEFLLFFSISGLQSTIRNMKAIKMKIFFLIYIYIYTIRSFSPCSLLLPLCSLTIFTGVFSKKFLCLQNTAAVQASFVRCNCMKVWFASCEWWHIFFSNFFYYVKNKNTYRHFQYTNKCICTSIV